MQVGAIGGAAAGLTGAGATGAAGSLALGGASAPMTVGEALAGSIVGSVEQLAEFLQGFTSAEILFALMMMSAMQKDDENESSGSAALGFLAGLAMAGFLGQSLGSELLTPPSETAGSAGVGSNIDFSA